ncbi:hypothetical protein [Campylobacter devanensis]|uniref:hypothetical protein n=1 Tax=Campylobacter devanensis TaxID=3161138 RepID=UPI00112FCA65|nr:hypothetical protein [Campylobacter sp. P0106]
MRCKRLWQNTPKGEIKEGKNSVVLCVVFDLLSIITTTITKKPQISKIKHFNVGGGRVDMGKKVFFDFKGYFVRL